MQALRAGFGSVMYDGSREKTSEENIRKSAEIVRIAHGMAPAWNASSAASAV